MATPPVAATRSRALPPKRRRRWPWVLLGAIVMAAFPVWVSLSRERRQGPDPWELTSDRFLEGLVLGSAQGRDGRTGFAAAWDLLTPEKKEALPFDVFFEEWTRLFDERGFIVEKHRTGDKKARGRERDPIEHLLFLGGESDDHSRLTTMKLRLVMERGVARIAGYGLTAVPNPRAAR